VYSLLKMLFFRNSHVFSQKYKKSHDSNFGNMKYNIEISIVIEDTKEVEALSEHLIQDPM